MKSLFSLLLIAATPLFGLDAVEIRRLAKEPHRRENLVPELLLYPDAQEYSVKVRSGKPGEPMHEGQEASVSEHTVDGKYLVSVLAFQGGDFGIHMVVYFENESGTYKKWVLMPDGTVASATGVGDLATRTISWISDAPAGDPPCTVLSLETHGDFKSTWSERFIHEGKVIWISTGEAIKLK